MAVELMSYVTDRFYPYFWHKFRFPVGEPTESECGEFVQNLRNAVWVHRIVSFRHWHPFVEMNLIPMTSSPEMYVSCLYFMISTTIEPIKNRYEPFMTTCSLVTAVAAYIYDKGFHEFLDYSPTILKVFFEKFHAGVFHQFKIWDHIQEYLISNNYSEAYSIVEEKTRRNPFADINFQLDFVREISLKINSKIPFSEHAAVYHQVLKVMDCCDTVGTIVTQSQSILAVPPPVPTVTAVRPPVPTVTAVRPPVPTVSAVRPPVPTVTAVRPPVQAMHEMQQVLEHHITTGTESTNINLPAVDTASLFDSEEVTFQVGGEREETCLVAQKYPVSEFINVPIVLIDSEEETEALKSPEKPEKVERSSERDVQTVEIKISSTKPDESVQGIEDSEETTCIVKEDIVAISTKTTLRISERSPQEDVETPESKQSTPIKKTEEMDSKQGLPCPSEEHSFNADVQELELEDIPVKADSISKPETPAKKDTEETSLNQSLSFEIEEELDEDDLYKSGEDEDTPVKSDLGYGVSNDDSLPLEESIEKESSYPGETSTLDENTETKSKPKPKRRKRRVKSKKQQQQQKEVDSEANLPTLAKNEVAQSLFDFMGKMLGSLKDVHDLLEIPVDFAEMFNIVHN